MLNVKVYFEELIPKFEPSKADRPCKGNILKIIHNICLKLLSFNDHSSSI